MRVLTAFGLAAGLGGHVFAAAPRLPKDFLAVPNVPQSTSYSCGAASLLSILYYWQVYDGHETSLFEPLKVDTEHGTLPSSIVAVAASHGLSATLQENTTLDDLRDSLERGETVILNIQAWRPKDKPPLPWKDTWKEGHYVVLVGMDEENAYTMDPSGYWAHAWLPLKELEERWHDEDTRPGHFRRYQRLAIHIKGKTPLSGFPAAPLRLE